MELSVDKLKFNESKAHINSIPWRTTLYSFVATFFTACVTLHRNHNIWFVCNYFIHRRKQLRLIFYQTRTPFGPNYFCEQRETHKNKTNKMQQITALNHIARCYQLHVSRCMITFFLFHLLMIDSCCARGPHHPRGGVKRRVEQQKHINEHLAFDSQYVCVDCLHLFFVLIK